MGGVLVNPDFFFICLKSINNPGGENKKRVKEGVNMIKVNCI
jgi:hypothetical protein